MLKKRSRPVHKELAKGHLMFDSSADPPSFSSKGSVQKVGSTSFFSVPGLFVGFNSKGSSDSDAARSPTSPLDLKSFSNLGRSFLGSPISAGGGGKPRSWDSNRVGLGLVDTLNEEPAMSYGKVSESRKILLGSQMRINISSPKSHLNGLLDYSSGAATKSLPKDYGITSFPFLGSPKPQKTALKSQGVEFELGEIGILRSSLSETRRTPSLTKFSHQESKSSSEVFPSDLKESLLESSEASVQGGTNFEKFSGSIQKSISSSYELISSLHPGEIEQSEDYTCVISHGPNPKMTHFFGDCILDSHVIQSPDFKTKLRKEWEGSPCQLKSSVLPPCPTNDDFLSFCFSCKKKLEEGEDIYMYRGEKAFCSCDCRDQEILIEEDLEKPTISSADSPGSSFHEEMFLEGMAS